MYSSFSAMQILCRKWQEILTLFCEKKFSFLHVDMWIWGKWGFVSLVFDIFFRCPSDACSFDACRWCPSKHLFSCWTQFGMFMDIPNFSEVKSCQKIKSRDQLKLLIGSVQTTGEHSSCHRVIQLWEMCACVHTSLCVTTNFKLAAELNNVTTFDHWCSQHSDLHGSF